MGFIVVPVLSAVTAVSAEPAVVIVPVVVVVPLVVVVPVVVGTLLTLCCITCIIRWHHINKH